MDRDELVTSHVRFARMKAYAAASKLRRSKHYDTDDLVSAALLGLVKAADAFDPDCGVPFTAYASVRVTGEILDHVRRCLPMSRTQAATERLVEVSMDDAPSWSNLRQVYASRECSPLERADEMKHLRSLARTDSERVLVRLYYRFGVTLKDIGAVLGVTESRACQIKRSFVNHVRSSAA